MPSHWLISSGDETAFLSLDYDGNLVVCQRVMSASVKYVSREYAEEDMKLIHDSWKPKIMKFTWSLENG